MTVSIDEAENRLRAALAAKADAVLDEGPGPALELSGSVVHLSGPGPLRHHRRLGIALTAAVAATVALVVGLTVAGGSHRSSSPATPRPSASTSTSPNPHGIPWGQVGPGWTLLSVAAATKPDSNPATLYLASPSGQRYRIGAVPADARLQPPSWTTDPDQAVLQTTSQVLTVDLHTGARTTFALPDPANTYAYQAGSSIVLLDGGKSLHRVDARGMVLTDYGTSQLTGLAVSPGAAMIAGGTDQGVTFYDTGTGKQLSQVAWPPGYSGCEPGYWPNGNEVIASCLANHQRVNVAVTAGSGGTATPMTLPGGWQSVQFQDGVLAYKDGARQLMVAGDLTIARSDQGGLHPLSVPSALRGQDWMVDATDADGWVLYREGTVGYVALVHWNPLSGQVVSLYDAGAKGGAVAGFASWPSRCAASC